MMPSNSVSLFGRDYVLRRASVSRGAGASRHAGVIRHVSARAFTLMELMIVVVIMGVLATLAIYSMTGYIQNSKTAEAREIVLSIMAGQEAYEGEVGSYLNVTGPIAAAGFYPQDPSFNGKTVIQWGANDGCSVGGVPCLQNFNALGVVVTAPVMFRYASTTVATGAAPTAGAFAATFNSGNVATPVPGYIVLGVSDLDGSGDGVYTAVVGSNLQSTLHFENVGE